MMNLIKTLIVSFAVTFAGAAANAAATGSNAAACVPQQNVAATPGKGGWSASIYAPVGCQEVATTACAKPETIAGFNGKFGFRVPATAGLDCSGNTETR